MKYLLISSCLLITLKLASQSPANPVFCGNELFSQIVHEHYPDLENAFRQTFENAKQAPTARDNDPLTIQVIVHVVWNDPIENLDESLILDQIAGLNEDFNRLNDDTSNLRSIFQDDAGIGNIHFELATIIRVHTENLFTIDLFGSELLTEVKHSEDGGSDAWNPETFMNIWIVKIQPLEFGGEEVGQILGFAFPPNGLDHWPDGSSAPTLEEDGVVLDYRIVGRNNPNVVLIPGTQQLLTVRGRSATHEVGHYLGLRHIWGDGGFLGLPNDCAQSDGIDDTPYADSQSAFDCNKTKNSCDQVETHYNENMPDLIENYMDYASDDCMNMFTKGQVSLMRNVLSGPRVGLIQDPSSVMDERNHLDFNLSPNPTNDVVRIDFEVTETTEITVRLSDIGGHLTLANIKQQYLPGKHHLPISLGGFSPGIYFVELRTKDGVGVRKVEVCRFD